MLFNLLLKRKRKKKDIIIFYEKKKKKKIKENRSRSPEVFCEKAVESGVESFFIKVVFNVNERRSSLFSCLTAVSEKTMP